MVYQFESDRARVLSLRFDDDGIGFDGEVDVQAVVLLLDESGLLFGQQFAAAGVDPLLVQGVLFRLPHEVLDVGDLDEAPAAGAATVLEAPLPPSSVSNSVTLGADTNRQIPFFLWFLDGLRPKESSAAALDGLGGLADA